MELWDVYDINRKKLDKQVVRGTYEKLNDDERRIVVHFCLFNSKNQMLIQQRQTFRKSWAGMWDITVGGSVVAGEDSLQGVLREVREEIGLELDLKVKTPAVTFYADDVFDDVYILKRDVEISELKLQEQEVKDVKWATKEEIFDMLDSGEFIPYKKNFISLAFDMVDIPGNRNIKK